MATAVLESGFTTGEVAPALFGNVALARMHSAAATCRNFFIGYQGGAYSRAGTALVGLSKQTGRNLPPRMITFQFSINQGLALEFGNFYMRVIFNGGFVTEPAAVITGITQSNPGVITFGAEGAATATALNSGVTSSYAPGDTVTLAGGVFTTPAVLLLSTTALLSALVNAPGTNYTPGDTINANGGLFLTAAILQVATTQLVSATVTTPGFGGVTGPAVLTGTTGTGTKFQVNALIGLVAPGVVGIQSIVSVVTGGDYTVNPNLTAEPVTGGSVTGGQLDLVMGARSVNVLSGGAFTANPAGGNMGQSFSSGGGTGATFNGTVFGPGTLAIHNPGVYTVFPPNPVAQGATSGTGAGATFDVTSVSPSFNAGDWLFLDGINGMVDLNGRTVVVEPVTATTYQIFDAYGNPIDTTGFAPYISGGTGARIYTLQTPYAEADLKYLKFTQSADVMSICCVNQDTGTEYAPLDLARFADDNWVFTPAVPAPTIAPPATTSAVASSSGSTDYEYVVTAVSPADGSESVASPIAAADSAVDIASTSGTITVTWSNVLGVNQYNIYKATPQLNGPPPAGALFGFAGSAYGAQFVDNNVVPDFTQVPPVHKNPFARGQALDGKVLTGGANYTTITLTISSTTGSGAILEGVLVGEALSAIIVVDNGQNYSPGDTIIITGDGAGATASLVVGPLTGTYPGVVAYFQQRRAYAYTINQPDTYFMSQPGSYTNFDARIPTIDSDAITGTPWSVEVNGIQFMIAVTGGLMVLTGLEAYFLAGTGSSPFQATPLTPSSQSAIPQGFNGCSATVPPIRIYQDVIYVQAKGSTYRDFSFNISTYTYTGDDITQNSTQLFNTFTIKDHAWCEEPFRVLWAVRSDGILLSLTFVKPEKVIGWARSDTNGSFESVCSVTEPPVDALYLAAQRQIGANLAYTIERMDNRLWSTVEDCWCVDCGLSLPMDEPAATLAASSATGLGSLTGVTGLVGGSGYSASAFAQVIDDNGKGPGVGATPVLTIVAGVITAVTFPIGGAGYTYPRIDIIDPAGSAGGHGAFARAVLNNSMVFTASAAVFQNSDVGRVIRMGGGVATITAFTDSQHVTANITSPIAAVQANSGGLVQLQPSGSWTISTPVTTVGGLSALAGATVTGLADGVAIPPMVVSANGQIVLTQAASQVTIGMAFQPQLQSVYLDAGEPTVQGQRGKLGDVTARINASGPFQIGSSQVDGSTLSPVQVAPAWTTVTGMSDAPVTTRAPYNSITVPLCTDDIRIPVQGGYTKHKQVAVQQLLPYPLNVLAVIPEFLAADASSQEWPKKQPGRGG